MAIVQRHIEDEHGYLSWLDARVDATERGRIVMAISYSEKLTDTVSPPTIHGDIAAALIDTVDGIVLRTILGDPFASGVVTINLNVNYLRRASGDLTVVAEITRAGGSVGMSTITVVSTGPEKGSNAATRRSSSNDWNDTTAIGQGMYRLFQE